MNGDRTVKVTLLAQVTGFVGGMATAARSAQKFSSELQKAAALHHERFNEMGRSMGLVALAFGGIAGIAVKKFADFDQAMDQVEAVTRESANGMDRLREAALLAGAETVFTAVESAHAIEELAKAGVSTSDILGGGLRGALDLAASSGLGVARAAEIAAGALGMFKLEGSDVAHVADVLSAGAAKSIGEVDDLAWALRQAGPVAHSMGLSLDETVGALSAFASTGRIGLDAGTSFKRMLQLLTPQSQIAADKMEELGIDAYDAQGNFIGLTQFAGQLQERLGGLTTEARLSALSIIFGSDAIAAASEVYKQGEEGIRHWIDAVNDEGYAAENAAIRLGNLKGDVEQLTGSLDAALVNMGSSANGPLRAITQGLTDMVNAFASSSDELQGSVFWFITVAGLVTALGAAFFLTVPKIAQFNAGIQMLALTMPKLAAGIKAVQVAGGWLAAAFVGFTALQTWSDSIRDGLRMTGADMKNLVGTTQSGSNIIKGVFEGIDGRFKDVAVRQSTLFDGTKVTQYQAQWQTAGEAVKDFAGTLDEMMQYNSNRVWGSWDNGLDDRIVRIKELGDSFAELAGEDLPRAQESFKLLASETDGSQRQLLGLLNLMPAYRDALVDMATEGGYDATDAQVLLNLAMGEGEEATQANIIQLEKLAGVSEDTMASIEELAKQIEGFGEAEFNVRDATRELEQGFMDLQTQFDENAEAGVSAADALALNTEAGIATTGTMDGLAASINAAAAAEYIRTGSIEATNSVLETNRKRLFDMIRPLYETDAAAQQYVDTLISTPEEIATEAKLSGIAEAGAELEAFISRYQARTISINVRANMTDDLNGEAPGSGRFGVATGGTIRGPGTGTSDSIPVWLSDGEEVTRAMMADKYRPLLKAINADKVGQYLRSTMGGMATGGTVGTTGPLVPGGPRQVMGGIPAIKGGDTWAPVFPIMGGDTLTAAKTFEIARRLKIRVSNRRA